MSWLCHCPSLQTRALPLTAPSFALLLGVTGRGLFLNPFPLRQSAFQNDRALHSSQGRQQSAVRVSLSYKGKRGRSLYLYWGRMIFHYSALKSCGHKFLCGKLTSASFVRKQPQRVVYTYLN